MRIFIEHKIEWLIGVICTFLPAILSQLVSLTEDIPDVKIPFWLLCIFISIPLGYLAAKQYNKKIKNIANKSFFVQREHVDGKHYANCTFDGTELVFMGISNFSLSGNTFITQPRISLDGYASTTINQLIIMYSDQTFRPIVDATLQNIRNKGLEIEHSNARKAYL